MDSRHPDSSVMSAQIPGHGLVPGHEIHDFGHDPVATAAATDEELDMSSYFQTPRQPTLRKLDTSLSLSSGSSKLQHGLATPIGSDENDLSPRPWSPASRRMSDLNDEPFQTSLPPAAFDVLAPDPDDIAAAANAQWFQSGLADMPSFANMGDFDPSSTTTPTIESRRGLSRPRDRRSRQSGSSTTPTGASTVDDASYADAGSGAPSDKRTRFLERNRVAAAKCRAKKKEQTGALEAHVRAMSADKEALTALSASLREELLYLKGEVLRHAGCADPAIEAHVRQQVGNITGVGKRKSDNHADGGGSGSSSSKSSSKSSSRRRNIQTGTEFDARAPPTPSGGEEGHTEDYPARPIEKRPRLNRGPSSQRPPRLQREMRHTLAKIESPPEEEVDERDRDARDREGDHTMTDGEFEKLLLDQMGSHMDC